MNPSASTQRYLQLIEASQRVRWDIDRDVIRGRNFDYTRTFLPAGLSLADEIAFLKPADRRFLSQVQGSVAWYRLAYPLVPGLHHWTRDVNERNVLVGQRGWVEEDHVFVIP